MRKILLATLLFSSVAQANPANEILSELFIKDRRQAIDLKLDNRSNKELYCENINIDVSLVGDEFGESLGEITLAVGPFYFQPQQDFVLNDVAAEQVSAARTSDTVAIISRAKVSAKNCKEVGFVEYCKYAEKTADELYTLDRLMKAAKTGRCEDIERNLDGKLRLEEQAISNLEPISYLASLKRISLKDNKITDLSLLKTLTALQDIDVSKNPLTEIDTLLQLPNIKAIDASHTQVYYKGVDYNQYSLRKVYLRNTPYERQKPR